MEKCLREPEIAILQEHIKTLYKRQEDANRKMDKVEAKQDAIYKISESIAVMAEKMGGIREDVQEIKGEVLGVKKDVGVLKDKINEDHKASLKEENDYFRKYKWHIVLVLTSLIVGYFFNSWGGL